MASKRGCSGLSSAGRGSAGQVAASSAAISSISRATSAAADSCIASATISTAEVSGRTADPALCRLVQRRAWALPAASANTTSPGRGCSVSPENAW